jgi:hypothetical protein
MPFVCFVKWMPEERSEVIKRFSQVFDTPEGHGVKGLHAWNLIGRHTMIVIGWTKSHVSLQKFCTSITHGTGISMDICPAIDQFGLREALGLKAGELESKTPKARG